MEKIYNFNFFTPCVQQAMDKMSEMFKNITSSLDLITLPQIEMSKFNQMFENIDYISYVLNSIFEDCTQSIDFDIICNTYTRLIDQLNYSFSYDFSSLFDNISSDSTYIEIDNATVNTLSDFFVKYNEEPPQNLKSKMSIKDFILCILIPFICMLLPMLQNNYYHQLDSAESQKNQLQESEYNAALLEIESQHNAELEKLNNNINELLQYLESVQNSQPTPVPLPAPIQDVQGTQSEAVDADVETVDDNCNPDVY